MYVLVLAAANASALVVDVAVEVDDIAGLEEVIEALVVVGRLPVEREHLGEQNGALIFAVELEIQDRLVRVHQITHGPHVVEVVPAPAVGHGELTQVRQLHPRVGKCTVKRVKEQGEDIEELFKRLEHLV